MCILSGCDYASSIRGIGLQRARKVVESAGEKGIKWALQNMREILKMPSIIVPDSYYDKFSLADKIFQHQAVFNPSTRKVVPLSGDTSNEYFFPEAILLMNLPLTLLLETSMFKLERELGIFLCLVLRLKCSQQVHLATQMQLAQRIPRMVAPNTQVRKQSVLIWSQSHFYGLLLVFLY